MRISILQIRYKILKRISYSTHNSVTCLTVHNLNKCVQQLLNTYFLGKLAFLLIINHYLFNVAFVPFNAVIIASCP